MTDREWRGLAELGGWPAALHRLFRREDLDAELARAALGEILAGRASDAEIAAFVAALRTKGESAAEITAFVDTLVEHGERIELGAVRDLAIDTCGTGGDRSGTINVSTLAAFIAASAGVPVLKHGGRAASSRAGSADVLDALGVRVELGPAGVERCLAELNIGFCWAPRYHPALRHAVAARRAVGVATVFNFLGPLANPGGVLRQIVGVGDATMAEKLLQVLEDRGAIHAFVLYGNDGLDELSTVTTSTVFETRRLETGERVRRSFIVDPADLGLSPARLEDLVGGDAEENARHARDVLAGVQGPKRDVVILNAAAAFVVAGRAEDLATGIALAEAELDSGRASALLDRFVVLTNEMARLEAELAAVGDAPT